MFWKTEVYRLIDGFVKMNDTWLYLKSLVVIQIYLNWHINICPIACTTFSCRAAKTSTAPWIPAALDYNSAHEIMIFIQNLQLSAATGFGALYTKLVLQVLYIPSLIWSIVSFKN